MGFVQFISKRLVKGKNTGSARRVINIATVSVALSIAVMLISVSVLSGFKSAVKEKIVGFGSHIQIVPYSINNTFDDNPIYIDNATQNTISKNKNIKSITPVINKSSVIICDDAFHAVILKGITQSYDTTFFHDALTVGAMPRLNKTSHQECIISKNTADKLKLNLNDKIKIYFYIDNGYRAKNFYVSGIYDTGLGDYDDRFLICDAAVLQNIFSMEATDYSAYEVSLNDFSKLDATADEVYQLLPNNMTLQTITDIEPNLFSWLNLLDSNVIMIIGIMILLTVVTLCGVVLIMIFEKKQTIGILKAIGSPNDQITQIFLHKAGYIALKGLFYGNILALALELIQKYTHLITLDAQSYYLTNVPISINALHIIGVDILAFAVCLLCMLIPAKTISKISVTKNLRFE